MKALLVALAACSLFSLKPIQILAADSIQIVECEPVDKKQGDNGKLWPSIYIKKDKICFDVTGLMNYKGQNCIDQNGFAYWSAIVLLWDNKGESLGRDYTEFRVSSARVTEERIEYSLEWRRSGPWTLFQRVSINRLTGAGVDWDVEMHGGTSIMCKAKGKKF